MDLWHPVTVLFRMFHWKFGPENYIQIVNFGLELKNYNSGCWCSVELDVSVVANQLRLVNHQRRQTKSKFMYSLIEKCFWQDIHDFLRGRKILPVRRCRAKQRHSQYMWFPVVVDLRSRKNIFAHWAPLRSVHLGPQLLKNQKWKKIVPICIRLNKPDLFGSLTSESRVSFRTWGGPAKLSDYL